MDQIIYLEKPKDFSSKLNTVGCYLECNGKFLFLQYTTKFQCGWGVPGGKMEKGEDPVAAVLRELYEETKLWLTPEEVQLVDKTYFREPADSVFYMFKVTLPAVLVDKVTLSSEHQNYAWVSYKEAINLPLIYGAKEALEHLIKATKRIERHKIISSVYLILKKNNKYLLYLRHNTGFEDGKYGLVAGHIEYGESAKQALIREALEEANIILTEEDLKFVHVSCRYSDRENIDIFFECDKWQGEIANNEPHKCAELKFFSLHELPSNIISYIKDVIVFTTTKVSYSEFGWDQHPVNADILKD
jgi:8-oxo-dGTP pyrophosphatase MutT (NUDIX family)